MSLSFFHVKGVSPYILILVSIVRRRLPLCLLLFLRCVGKRGPFRSRLVGCRKPQCRSLFIVSHCLSQVGTRRYHAIMESGKRVGALKRGASSKFAQASISSEGVRCTSVYMCEKFVTSGSSCTFWCVAALRFRWLWRVGEMTVLVDRVICGGGGSNRGNLVQSVLCEAMLWYSLV